MGRMNALSSSSSSPTSPAADAATVVRIDFVSDVSCPWCAIGLHALEAALQRVAPGIQAEIHLHPFELNPQMVPKGEDVIEHLTRKYGRSADELRATQDMIRERGAAVGFEFRQGARSRIYNTFDAHRLLAWAETVQGDSAPAGAALALKHALLRAYFTEGLNPGDRELLAQRAAACGLDEAEARAVLASDRHADEVRERERQVGELGIHSVPAVILNQRWLISGGQPVEVFERSLRDAGAAPHPVG
jgi:predicted DsbA family dithiol-disulfide isomerase